jgi:hypothetical protein
MMTLQQVADEIVNNPKLRVLYVGQNHPRAMDFILALARLLPTSLIEKVRRQQILCMGWDGRNPTVTATIRDGVVAGVRIDLIIVEGDSLPRGFDERFRCRLTINGRVEFFSWDGERR